MEIIPATRISLIGRDNDPRINSMMETDITPEIRAEMFLLFIILAGYLAQGKYMLWLLRQSMIRVM